MLGFFLLIEQDIIGASVVLVAGVTTMTSAAVGSLEPSLVGLAIMYALSVSRNIVKY